MQFCGNEIIDGSRRIILSPSIVDIGQDVFYQVLWHGSLKAQKLVAIIPLDLDPYRLARKIEIRLERSSVMLRIERLSNGSALFHPIPVRHNDAPHAYLM